MDMQQLFSEAIRLEASDLHLIVGFPPMLRINGNLAQVEGAQALTVELIQQLVESTMDSQQKLIYSSNREVDYSVAAQGGRFRANAYYQQNTVAGAFRLIPSKIRGIDELGLPGICKEFIKLRQGLILVTGPTGHGKSTSLAAMIQHINTTRAEHIVTIEDPIEYVYPHGKSIVSQREMHGDTHSWAVALRSVLREDPNVVLVGEMRDFDTIQAALTVAETGHLVFATLHTNSAAQSIDRIVDVFPQDQQTQIRMQLASVLSGVISQRLLPTITGQRTLAAEILTGTPAVRTLIRDAKTHQVDNLIQTSAEYGMVTLEVSLAALVKAGTIHAEVAASYALRPEELSRVLKSQGTVTQDTSA